MSTDPPIIIPPAILRPAQYLSQTITMMLTHNAYCQVSLAGGAIMRYRPGISWAVYRCKYTSHPQGRLIVRNDDAIDGIYVLIVGSGRRYRIAGAITGAQARQIGEKTAPNGGEPAWFVSQKQLKPISEL